MILINGVEISGIHCLFEIRCHIDIYQNLPCIGRFTIYVTFSNFLPNVFGVRVLCRNLYSFVVYLYVNGSGSITSVWEERANLSAVVYL